MISFFYFQETYNSRLNEKYKDDPLTHPNFNLYLWMEAESSGGSNINPEYRLSNTTTKNLWTTRSVSTIGSSQLIPSTQFSEFTALLQYGVQEHTTHLNEKYEWLSADYEELRRMILDIRSQMGGTYTPSYWPYGLENDQPPPPPPSASPLF